MPPVYMTHEHNDDDDVMIDYLKRHRRELQQLPSRDDCDRLSSPTDCVDNRLSAPTSSSLSSSMPVAAESCGVGSMATHRMPATLPLTTSKQHQHHSSASVDLTR